MTALSEYYLRMRKVKDERIKPEGAKTWQSKCIWMKY